MNIMYYVIQFDGDEYIELHKGYDAREALDIRDKELAENKGFETWVAVDYDGSEELH